MNAHVPMVKLKCPVFVRRYYCLYLRCLLYIQLRFLLTPLIDNQWRTSASGSNSGIQLAPAPQFHRPFVSVLFHLQIIESVENCEGCFRCQIVRNVTASVQIGLYSKRDQNKRPGSEFRNQSKENTGLVPQHLLCAPCICSLKELAHFRNHISTVSFPFFPYLKCSPSVLL